MYCTIWVFLGFNDAILQPCSGCSWHGCYWEGADEDAGTETWTEVPGKELDGTDHGETSAAACGIGETEPASALLSGTRTEGERRLSSRGATLSVVLTGAGAVIVKAGQCVGTHAVEDESLETKSSRYGAKTGDAPGPCNVVCGGETCCSCTKGSQAGKLDKG
jgi:hypothetical protein